MYAFWDRRTLKNRAKSVLRKKYWWTFLALLIVGILGSGNLSVASYNYSGSSNGYSNVYDYGYYPGYDAAMIWRIASIVLAVVGVFAVFAILYSIFVGNVIDVGGYRFMCANTVEANKPDLSNIFFGFKRGFNYLNIVRTIFLRNLFVFLWSLLLIIPGIIKGYAYFMVPYIMAENPNIPWQRAFEISKRTTQGEKWDIFVLGLSFLGWILLAALTLGLGFLFLNPYIQATHAELYGALRFKAAKCGYCTRDEIGAEHFG